MREIDYSGTLDLALSHQNQISCAATLKSRQTKHLQWKRAEEEKCDWWLREKSLFHPNESCILNSRQTERSSLLGLIYTQPGEECWGADRTSCGCLWGTRADVPRTPQWKMDKIWSSKICRSPNQIGAEWLCVGHMSAFGPQQPDWTAAWFSCHSHLLLHVL